MTSGDGGSEGRPSDEGRRIEETAEVPRGGALPVAGSASPSSAPSSPSSAPPPDDLGPYRIEGELGRGGMGVVYIAEDTRLERKVAIKLLTGRIAENPESLAQFEGEAKLLASLNHPNISTIHSLEEIEGVRFITLELIPGRTVAEVSGADRDELLSVFRQITLALEAAHAAGIIHCDLKPENIKVTPEGLVKVLDFGIARALGSSSHTPASEEEVTGTPGYMSPEQLRGKPMSPRTDIWAFGCLLFECLSGTKAFLRESVEKTLEMTIESEPDWDALPGGTSEKLRELLVRCLERDPEQRLDTISEARSIIEAEIAPPAVSRGRKYDDLDQAKKGALRRSLGEGDKAPPFSLRDQNGVLIDSDRLLADGPLVVSFYRGKW